MKNNGLNFKFGITELGDGGLDLSWKDRMHSVSGAVIISKCASDELINTLLKFKDKVIYHAVCSGFGGTLFEPNVPTINEKFKHIKKLIFSGFPSKQIVVRIDPLIPLMWEDKINNALGINYFENLNDILYRTESLDIKRVRYSYLDFSLKNLNKLKLLNHELDFDIKWTLKHKNEFLLSSLNKNLEFEACCEFNVPNNERIGCISNKDLEILKLDNLTFNKSNYKNNCLCPENKLELLNNKFMCEHKCIYCNFNENNRKF